MRIIRGHDYYDSALAYGQDDDITFVRDTKLFDTKDTPLSNIDPTSELINYGSGRHYYRSYWNTGNEVRIRDRAETRRYPIYSITVYFCDKRYQGFGCDIGEEKHVFWSREPLVQWLESLGQTVNTTPNKWRYSDSKPVTLDEYFTPRSITVRERDWMMTNRIAIAIWSGDKQIPGSIEDWEYYKQNKHGPHGVDSPWRCNSAEVGNALKEYKFMKVLDPYTAMQELGMWISNLPKDGPAMVTITDEKMLVKKHGFDKWSFRKHKDDVK